MTLQATKTHISTDALITSDEFHTLIDVLSSDSDEKEIDKKLNYQESLDIDIRKTLSILTDREKRIIEMFFGIGREELNLQDIGKEFGLTKERIRQIKQQALLKLQEPSNLKLLKAYL
jgi:RNA polymerase primary sigma factor